MELIDYIVILIKVVVVLLAQMAINVPIMVWCERRGAGFIQDRIGPNRVGPFGVLQPIADSIKLFFKEDMIPSKAHKFLFILAPIAMMAPALMAYAVIPFGNETNFFGLLDVPIKLQVASLNIGILYVFAIGSLGVYGLLLAGWSSNNKYSLLGGIRAGAQMLSYELPLIASTLGVLLLAGSLDLVDIVSAQKNIWFVFPSFIGFFVFWISSFAETNRNPFDMPEGESELVGGYHTEYSSMKFAMFFMSEYINMLTISSLMVILFFGGWHPLPFLPWEKVIAYFNISEAYFNSYLFFLPTIVFIIKVGFFMLCFIWVRWTVPRFRYDQLMGLGWKKLLPLAFLNVFIVAIGMLVFN